MPVAPPAADFNHHRATCGQPAERRLAAIRALATLAGKSLDTLPPLDTIPMPARPNRVGGVPIPSWHLLSWSSRNQWALTHGVPFDEPRPPW